MKLQAVTICINYADYLESMVVNRQHFDRWIIVTVPSDQATLALCEEYGLGVVISTTLAANGRDFDAAYNKAGALNEGLSKLDPDGWALVLDADVLLPRDFRRRLEALSLEEGCIYAAAGRRVCEDRSTLEALRHLEPWDRFVDRNTQALGYFNLFSLQSGPNRYPENAPREKAEHDDFLFTNSFAPIMRRQVPMTLIHAGPIRMNWAQRLSKRFFAKGAAGRGFEDLLETVITETGGGTVGVVGYFPGGRSKIVAKRFSAVLAVDHFAVGTPGGHPFIEADRSVLRNLWEEETAEMQHLHRLGSHDRATLAQIPADSLDALYFPGEIAPSWLVEALPLWFEKLKPRGIIFGDLYGLPRWREATFTLSLLIGAPDETGRDDSWWKRLDPPPQLTAPDVQPTQIRSEARPDGVVLVNVGNDTVASLLFTAHSAREHWRGSIRIYQWGEENDSLSIACSRLGISLWILGDETAATGDFDTQVTQIAASQPYRRFLLLRSGMLVVRSLDEVFGAGPECFTIDAGSIAGDLPDPLLIEDGKICPLPLPDTDHSGKSPVSVLTLRGEIDAWSDLDWEHWSLREAAVASAMAPEVRLLPGTTIVSIVTSENAGDFQRNWLTWRFRGNPPVLLLLIGISASEFWLPDHPIRPMTTEVPTALGSDSSALLARIADLCATERVIFLPAGASALPGAELWLRADDLDAVTFHDTAIARNEEAVTSNCFLPEPFFGLVSRQALIAISEWGMAKKFTDKPLSLLMRVAVDALKLSSSWSDASQAGWKFEPTHYYWRQPREQSPGLLSPSNAAQVSAPEKEWLAEDVVVINLPERVDRRERITAMMEKENLGFRIVDGIRVAYDEIEASEVAEVGRTDVKVLVSWEKYLCGMVGCRRAHLACLKEAFDSGLKSLLIVEDDMTLLAGWRPKLDAALASLPPGWLQLYFSAGEFTLGWEVVPGLRRLAGAFQTTAILYSEAGIDAAFRCLSRSRMEIDCWMGKHLHPYGASYVVHPAISRQDGGMSDIMNFNRGITP